MTPSWTLSMEWDVTCDRCAICDECGNDKVIYDGREPYCPSCFGLGKNDLPVVVLGANDDDADGIGPPYTQDPRGYGSGSEGDDWPTAMHGVQGGNSA